MARWDFAAARLFSRYCHWRPRAAAPISSPHKKRGSMKEPEDMTIADMRAELRAMGVTERLSQLILREMGEAERRIEQAQKGGKKGKYDPLRAQLHVLKAHGMTNPDLSLNRKGTLFIQLTTREQEMGPSAQSA
jgi:hypothetical protein